MKLVDEQKSGCKRTMLNQILFVWAYWFVLYAVFHFLNGSVFEIKHSGVVGATSLLEQVLTRTIPFTWASFAVGLTPFLVGAVWCRHNQFYQKMTKNSVLLKVMWGMILIQSIIVLLTGIFTSSEDETRFACSVAFILLMPLLLWFLFYVLHSEVTLALRVARRGKESRAEWGGRVGTETIEEITDAQRPLVSASASILGLLVLAFV